MASILFYLRLTVYTNRRREPVGGWISHWCLLRSLGAVSRSVINMWLTLMSRQREILPGFEALVWHVLNCTKYLSLLCSGVARKFFRGSKSRGSFPPVSFPSSPSSRSPPFPSPALHFFPLPFPFSSPLPPPFPPLPSLRSRTPKIQLGVWGALWAPPAGSGAEQPKSNLVH